MAALVAAEATSIVAASAQLFNDVNKLHSRRTPRPTYKWGARWERAPSASSTKASSATLTGLWLVWRYQGDKTLDYYLKQKSFPENVAVHLSPSEVGRRPGSSKEDNFRYEGAVVRALMSQILSTLKDLHRTGVVHRDVKPSNLVLAQDCGALKLIDLGACVDLRTGHNYVPNETVMDPKYAAPERFVMPPKATPPLPPDPICSMLSPLLWMLNTPDRFDLYSAGVIFMQLCLKPLRHEAGLDTFNADLKKHKYDLDKWRRKSRIGDSEFALLDADGGAGWELARALLRPRLDKESSIWPSLGRSRPTAAKASNYRFFSSASSFNLLARSSAPRRGSQGAAAPPQTSPSSGKLGKRGGDKEREKEGGRKEKQAKEKKDSRERERVRVGAGAGANAGARALVSELGAGGGHVRAVRGAAAQHVEDVHLAHAQLAHSIARRATRTIPGSPAEMATASSRKYSNAAGRHSQRAHVAESHAARWWAQRSRPGKLETSTRHVDQRSHSGGARHVALPGGLNDHIGQPGQRPLFAFLGLEAATPVATPSHSGERHMLTVAPSGNIASRRRLQEARRQLPSGRGNGQQQAPSHLRGGARDESLLNSIPTMAKVAIPLALAIKGASAMHGSIVASYALSHTTLASLGALPLSTAAFYGFVKFVRPRLQARAAAAAAAAAASAGAPTSLTAAYAQAGGAYSSPADGVSRASPLYSAEAVPRGEEGETLKSDAMADYSGIEDLLSYYVPEDATLGDDVPGGSDDLDYPAGDMSDSDSSEMSVMERLLAQLEDIRWSDEDEEDRDEEEAEEEEEEDEEDVDEDEEGEEEEEDEEEVVEVSEATRALADMEAQMASLEASIAGNRLLVSRQQTTLVKLESLLLESTLKEYSTTSLSYDEEEESTLKGYSTTSFSYEEEEEESTLKEYSTPSLLYEEEELMLKEYSTTFLSYEEEEESTLKEYSTPSLSYEEEVFHNI
eukprot:jgi/Mesen1/5705/ME000288S04910